MMYDSTKSIHTRLNRKKKMSAFISGGNVSAAGGCTPENIL